MKTLLVGLVVGSLGLLGPVAESQELGPEIKSGYIRTSDQVRLHYLEAGSGPAIVFVPGWTCPTWVWEPQIRHFSKHYRVVALDPRSQGESEQVTEGHYPERRAQDIQELIEQLRLAPAVVVGHSLAVWELLAYVDRFGTGTLAGVVLVDASINPQVSELVGLANEVSRNRRQLLERLTVEFFKTPQPPEYFRRLIDDSMKTPTNTALALLAGVLGRDFVPMLGKLDKPVLYAITPHSRRRANCFWPRCRRHESRCLRIRRTRCLWTKPGGSTGCWKNSPRLPLPGKRAGTSAGQQKNLGGSVCGSTPALLPL